MTDIRQITELAEHPERFTEEQMTELLQDEENLKLYITVSETMMAMEAQAEKRIPKPKRRMMWAVAASVAAVAVMGALWTWHAVPEGLAVKELQAKVDETPNTHELAGDSIQDNNQSTEATAIDSRQQEVMPQTANDIEDIVEEEDIDIESILQLQRERTESMLAMCEAEAILAEYYASQIASMEEPVLPAVSACMGDAGLPQENIMTLIMQ